MSSLSKTIHSPINRGKKYPDRSWLEVAQEDPDYLRRHVINKPHISASDQELARQALETVGEPIKASDRSSSQASAPPPAPVDEVAVIARTERALLVRDHVYRLLAVHGLAAVVALLGWGVYLGLIGGLAVDRPLTLLVTGTALAMLWIVETSFHRRLRRLMLVDDAGGPADFAFVERFPVHLAFASASAGTLLVVRPELISPATQLILPGVLLGLQLWQLMTPWRMFGEERPADESSRLAQWVALLTWLIVRFDRWARGRDERGMPTRKQVFDVARETAAELFLASPVRQPDAPEREPRVQAPTPPIRGGVNRKPGSWPRLSEMLRN